MKERVEILASGFGGQGVVRLGQIIGGWQTEMKRLVDKRTTGFFRRLVK